MDAATGIMDDQTPVVRALIGLTVVTGLVDAISFLGLGHIFTANMTGNVVFLGFGIAGSGGLQVVAPLVSLGSFWWVPAPAASWRRGWSVKDATS